MRCNCVCGAKIKNNQKFCTNCKANVEGYYSKQKREKNQNMVTKVLIVFFICVIFSMLYETFSASSTVDKEPLHTERVLTVREKEEIVEVTPTEKKEVKEVKEIVNSYVDFKDLRVKAKTKPWCLDHFLGEKHNSRVKDLGVKINMCEELYSVNSIFITALIIHESDYGRNSISLDKNNIMSINATNINTYKNAYSYTTMGECIADGCKLLKQKYLFYKGTYHEGYTLDALNIHYASDKRNDIVYGKIDPKSWADKVKDIMIRIIKYIEKEEKREIE